MAYTPSPENYFLGKGALYFDRFDSSGNKTGELHLGNCPDFSVAIDVSEKEHKSSLTGVATVDKKVTEQVTATVKFTLEEFVTENLLIALLGDEGTLTQAAGSVTTPEAYTVKTNRWYKLVYRNVSNVVVKDETDTTTYVENVDYRVDAEVGRVYIIPTGSISDDDVIHVTYDYGDLSTTIVKALENSQIQGYLRFIPATDQTGPRHECEVWKVDLRPSGEIGFISEDWAQMPIEGSITADTENHPDNPYFRLIKL